MREGSSFLKLRLFHERWVPHISLVFREMWDTTNPNVRDGCPTFAKGYVGLKKTRRPGFPVRCTGHDRVCGSS